jgi:hypothetical protein
MIEGGIGAIGCSEEEDGCASGADEGSENALDDLLDVGGVYVMMGWSG